MQVKILPTVICFNDGVAVHNIIGFDGLTTGLPDDKLDEWPLSNLARELALAKVRSFIADPIVFVARIDMTSLRFFKIFLYEIPGVWYGIPGTWFSWYGILLRCHRSLDVSIELDEPSFPEVDGPRPG